MNSPQFAHEGSLKLTATAAAILLLAIAGCNQQPDSVEKPASASKKIDVFVVNYPLAFFAEQIGDDLVNVNFPVSTEDDPAYWEPADDDVAKIQSADLVLLNGADYAKWTLRTSLPWSRTVMTTRDVEDQFIEVPNAVTHAHGPEGEHSHAGLATETWVDPQLAISQALVIKEELQELLPDSSEALEKNVNELKKQLLRLDEDFKATFAKSNLSWTASYPAFRYLDRRYDLNLQTLNWAPSEFPSDKQWAEFDKLIAKNKSSLMLWTEKPIPKTVERLEQRGIRVVIFRLAARRPESKNYLEVMRQNLAEVEAAVSSQSQD